MSHQITQTASAPQIKIITMTEGELTAKMEEFRRQIMSDIKSLMADTPQSVPADPTTRIGSNWVSAIELSRKYGVTINTIWRWCKSGKIPQPAKLADKRCTRWNLAEVEQALTRCA